MDPNIIHLHGDEEIIEVIDLDETDPGPDDLADNLEDVDFEDAGNNDDNNSECWETEDEMEPEEDVYDHSELTFSKHTGSVFCVSLDPLTNTMAITGGEDDKAYVWTVSNGEVLFECAGHKDSVTCASFSHDSSMVASGDMSGEIKVWKVETKVEIWSYEVGDLEWIEWHPGAPVLLAGTTAGNVWMWKIPSGDCKTFQGPGCQASSGKVLPDGKRAIVGYEDGSIRLWDLKQGNAIHVINGHDGHKAVLTCMACNKDGSLVMTGSVDGSAKLINTATGKVLGTFLVDVGKKAKSSKDEEQTNSVESVGFCSVFPLVAVAFLDGTLAVYDLSTQTLRLKCQHKAPIVRMQWEDNSSVVATCSLDGVLRLWDARSGNIVSEFHGHTAEILDFTLNREASLAITASGDNQAKVFLLQSPDR